MKIRCVSTTIGRGSINSGHKSKKLTTLTEAQQKDIKSIERAKAASLVKSHTRLVGI
jgi:hypothetical protein